MTLERVADGIASRWRERKLIVTTLFHTEREIALAALVVSILTGVLPIGFVVMLGTGLGSIAKAVGAGSGSSEWHTARNELILAGILFAAQQFVLPWRESLAEALRYRVDARMALRGLRAALARPGLAELEDPDLGSSLNTFVGTLEHAPETPGRACAGAIALVGRYLQLLGSAIVIAVVFSPLWAAILVVGTLVFRFGQRAGMRGVGVAFMSQWDGMRRTWYFRRTGLEPATAKELRIFTIAPWIRDRYLEAALARLRVLWDVHRRLYVKAYLLYVPIGGIAFAASLIAVGGATARHDITFTAFALAVQASIVLVGLGSLYPEADTQTEFGFRIYERLTRFEQAVADQRPAALPTATPGTSGRVVFEQVVFAYPGSDEPVLRGLDLTLEPGLCTAIVGLNGAGKTTIVKLLARLYEPTAGRITCDGVDISRFDVDEWRRRLAVILQDFNRYQSSLVDNVRFGAIESDVSEPDVVESLERAGLGELAARLPAGLETPLSSQLKGGVDLSGGQWQRVALARALTAVAHGARLMVLDEPTASLDVRGEASFFDEFVRRTRGLTTVLISHRFSTVRPADRIVAIDDGRVTEVGNHEELMEADGRYAHLFRLQAARFLEEGEESWTA